MPLEIQTDTVPQMKCFINGQNVSAEQESVGTFILEKTHLKTTQFISNDAESADIKLPECVKSAAYISFNSKMNNNVKKTICDP